MRVNLFCYGTLTLAPVMRAVCGGVVDIRPAVLAGYVCHALNGEAPAIVPRPGAQVAGLVYLAMPSTWLARLDRYEGPLYQRRKLRLTLDDGCAIQAWTYVLRMRYHHRRSRRHWSLHSFLHRQYRAYLYDLRARRGSQAQSW